MVERSCGEGLERFIQAQDGIYEKALAEIRTGKKITDWMHYIFPQLKGLGYSYMAKWFAIKDAEEAKNYIDHPILGKRLVEISAALLDLKTNSAEKVFGDIDALMLRSCMTLFAVQKDSDPVFELVLAKFFKGRKDPHPLSLLNLVSRP
jgi:uncharacterized protein (DUF1810 family)